MSFRPSPAASSARAAATTAAPAAPAAIDGTRAVGTAPEDSRERLLQTALRLFAEKGFAQTSTRELAESASVNVAAISYYFGDKAGLYRAACRHAMGSPMADIARFADPALALADVLRGFFEGFLLPLREGDLARLCMKLHLREMIEPTGLGERAMVDAIQPVQRKLAEVLARHLGLAGPDLEVQRLAVGMAALGVHVHCGRLITDAVAPGLYGGPRSIDDWSDRLVHYGVGMVRAEAARRGSAGQP